MSNILKELNKTMSDATPYNQTKNKKYTEQKAYEELEKLGFEKIIKVDEDATKFKDKIKTPDLMLGYTEINSETFTNKPEDIYIDIVGITGAMWDKKDGKHPDLKDDNIFMLIENCNSDNKEKIILSFIDIIYDKYVPYSTNDSILANKKNKIMQHFKENSNLIVWPTDIQNQKIIGQLMSPLNKKIKKYSECRKSNKNWIMMVESYMGGIEQKYHFNCLTELFFRHIFDWMTLKNMLSQENANKLYSEVLKINEGESKGEFVVFGDWSDILGNREDNWEKTKLYNGLLKNEEWLIISIIGTKLFKNTSIHFINAKAYREHKGDNTQEMKIIKEMVKGATKFYQVNE
jgi:hypothetical protein